jgi:hypothetical protein
MGWGHVYGYQKFWVCWGVGGSLTVYDVLELILSRQRTCASILSWALHRKLFILQFCDLCRTLTASTFLIERL